MGEDAAFLLNEIATSVNSSTLVENNLLRQSSERRKKTDSILSVLILSNDSVNMKHRL
jgi:hypothetical protein